MLLIRKDKAKEKASNADLSSISLASAVELLSAFSEYGQVASARVITDRYSGRPRGFGFVEMANDEEAQAAIDGLNGKDMKGRPLTVNQARPREAGGGRRPGGGGGGGYGGGGGGGGGYGGGGGGAY